jgi:choline dehydrogenase-like flavoprotein
MGAPDVIVVGGGAAGCVVAARLSEDPGCNVVLLEAGPDLRESAPEDIRVGWQPTRAFDWGYTSEPDELGVARSLPRGRLLGGCSSTNATFALRGAPADYDGWASRGNAGWSFDDVLPTFRLLERDLDFGDRPWHGSTGPVPIRRYRPGELTDVAAAGLAAFEDAGIAYVEDHNAPGAVGAGLVPVNCLDGIRMSTAITHLPRPGERPNLDVRCEAEVLDLVIEGDRATGVRLGSGEIVHAGCVVLCAGTYGSPPLLLRSGIGPAAELRRLGIASCADLPGVGANLADHPAVAIKLPYAPEPSPAPLFQIVATLRSSAAAAGDAPDLQLMAFGPYPASEDSPSTFMVAAALLKPHSRGQVTLRPELPGGAPRVDLGYLREPADLDRLDQGLELAESVAAHSDVRALCAGQSHEGADRSGRDARREWMRRTCWTYHHPVGTCSMGPASDPSAVVDDCGRVHGIAGLRVADASVMPDVPSANTHLPTLMVAERMAALLRG